MASALRKNLEEQVACSICQEQFTDPRILPCLHTFCKQCLEQLVQATAVEGQISCPECRHVMQIVHNGGVDELKVNFQMNNLISLLAVTSLEDKAKCPELVCQNCTSSDSAVGRCEDCCKFMCEFCFNTHRRFLETRDHRLMSMDEIKNQQGTAVLTQQQKCVKHKGEAIKLYCENCEQLICRDCTIIDHREHCYQFLDDVAEQHKKALKVALEEASDAKCKLEEDKNAVGAMGRAVKTRSKNIEKEIETVIHEHIEALKRKEKSLKDELSRVADGKIKHLEEQAEAMETHLKNLKGSIQFTQNVLQTNDNFTVLSISADAKSRLSALVEEMRSIDNQPCEGDSFCFMAGKDSVSQSIENEMYIRESNTPVLARSQPAYIHHGTCKELIHENGWDQAQRGFWKTVRFQDEWNREVSRWQQERRTRSKDRKSRI